MSFRNRQWGLCPGPHSSAHQKHTLDSFIKSRMEPLSLQFWSSVMAQHNPHAANHSSVAGSRLPIFANKALLEHSHIHLFTYRLKLFLHYNHSVGWVAVANNMAQKAKNMWPFTKKFASLWHSLSPGASALVTTNIQAQRNTLNICWPLSSKQRLLFFHVVQRSVGCAPTSISSWHFFGTRQDLSMIDTRRNIHYPVKFFL